MKKVLGYIFAILGIALLASTQIPGLDGYWAGFAQEADGTSANVSNVITSILVISIILVLAGVFLILRSGRRGKQAKEVPIYQGKHIVGYRRH